MDTPTCEFCRKTFKNKNVLDQHKKKTKYCLEIQGIENNKHKCEFCDKILASNVRLHTHLQVCKSKIKKEIEDRQASRSITYEVHLKELEKQRKEYEGRLKQLEEQLREKDRIIAEIALQPRGITHTHHTDNRVQTILTGQFDMTNVDRVSTVLDKYLDKNVVALGQKGLGEMIATRLLRDDEGKQLYVCSDVARHHFKFVNTEGLTETDPKAYRLIGLIQEAGLSSKTAEVMQAIYDDCDHTEDESPDVYSQSILELMTLKRDSSKFRSVLASITAKNS